MAALSNLKNHKKLFYCAVDVFCVAASGIELDCRSHEAEVRTVGNKVAAVTTEVDVDTLLGFIGQPLADKELTIWGYLEDKRK